VQKPKTNILLVLFQNAYQLEVNLKIELQKERRGIARIITRNHSTSNTKYNRKSGKHIPKNKVIEGIINV
jgi:hypothetical protein